MNKNNLIKTDILIIGAGPVGLFTVFEAGLLGLKCHLIDALPRAGGQLTELYPKKSIFDIPGIPEILAGDLIDNLMDQCKQFEPGFTLNETATNLVKLPIDLEESSDNLYSQGYNYLVETDKGTVHYAKAIIIAGGLGTFEPRKPDNIENLTTFENKGVNYFIKDPEEYRDKNVIIAGGGDSALDWTIHLSRVAKNVILVHRSNEFRGALDSLNKVRELKEQGLVELITEANVTKLDGYWKTDPVNTNDYKLKKVTIERHGESVEYEADAFIPLFGLIPRLGPIVDWGLHIEKNAIEVENTYYSTNREGIYAVGDVNTYEGKLKLILCGFHEATLAVQGIYKMLNPNSKFLLKYTTVSGVNGFDGTKKETEKSVTREI